MIIPPAAGLAGKGTDGSGQAADGLGKDDRHNAGHCHLDGQVGVLAAVDLPAHNALGVLNGDAALGIIDEDDEQHESNNANQNDDDLPPDQSRQSADHSRDAGDDVGKQDHGDTVADTEFRDLLAQPHDQSGAGGERQNDDQRGQEALGGDDGDLRRVVAQHHVVRPAHQQAKADRGVAGDALNFLLAILAAVLRQPLKSGDGDGQQLDDDGGVNVGLNAQCKHGGAGERAAGHCIVQAQDSTRQNAVEVIRQSGHVNERNRDDAAQTVNQQNEQGEEELLPQFRNLPGILECLQHLYHLGLSACLLNLFLGRLRESRGLNGNLLGQGAVGQHLQAIGAGGDDAGLDQSGCIHNSAVLKAVQRSNVDSSQRLRVDVVETALGDTTCQRHLAAFKSHANLAAGAGLLTLVATTAGLAVAGTGTTALTLAHLSGASNRRKFMKLHILPLLIQLR